MPAATVQGSGATRRARPSILDLNAGFALAGMATTLLGPVVPGLAERWHLSDATVATLFTTQWICSTSLTLLSSVLVVRFDAARVILAGYALAAAGVLALAVAPWPWTLVATGLYGCGLGLVLPTTNLLDAEYQEVIGVDMPGRSMRAGLELLRFCCPRRVSRAQR
jgi:MFS family permease